MAGPFTKAIKNLSDAECVRRAWDTGHFRNPLQVSETLNVQEKDVAKLTPKDRPSQYAFASYQDFLADDFHHLCDFLHGRRGVIDGEMGPATRALLGIERCMVPDFDEAIFGKHRVREDLAVVAEATGSGNWRGCHGVGDFHSAVCKVDDRRMTPHVKEVFLDALRLAQHADAEKGLLWQFVGQDMRDLLMGEDLSGEHVDTEMSFVPTSDGWIGLAIVGVGIQCRQRTIWLRLLNTYGSAYDRAQRAIQWAWLILHELTHNKGVSHTRGPNDVMRPALGFVSKAPNWDGDSLDRWHDEAYGGVIVPIPGSGPPKEKFWTHVSLRDADNPADEFMLFQLSPKRPRSENVHDVKTAAREII